MKTVYIYSDDWFSSIDIQRMSKSQELGFFRFLLAHSAAVQGKLCSDDAEIGRITRMGTRGWHEFKTRFSHLLTESEGFIWNPKQYEGWLKHENKVSAGRQGGLAKADSARRSASGFQPETASKPLARLKDLETKETSKSKERSLSLSLPEGNSVAEKGGDALDTGKSGTATSEPISSGGGLALDCEPPPEGLVVNLSNLPKCNPKVNLSRRDLENLEDSHELGQSTQPKHRAVLAKAQAGVATETASNAPASAQKSRARKAPAEAGHNLSKRGGRTTDASSGRATGPARGTIGVSLECVGRSKPIPCNDEPELEIEPIELSQSSVDAHQGAGPPPLDGAGGVDSDTSGVSSSGPGHPKQGRSAYPGRETADHDRQHQSDLGVEVASRGSTGPAPTPTEDPLFNRLYAWWMDCGGGCRNINYAYQQFLSVRESLVLKSNWNPGSFERSWVANGWDAAYRAGRNPGELQKWLREYDPDGSAGEWKKRGEPQTIAERLASL